MTSGARLTKVIQLPLGSLGRLSLGTQLPCYGEAQLAHVEKPQRGPGSVFQLTGQQGPSRQPAPTARHVSEDTSR